MANGNGEFGMSEMQLLNHLGDGKLNIFALAKTNVLLNHLGDGKHMH